MAPHIQRAIKKRRAYLLENYAYCIFGVISIVTMLLAIIAHSIIHAIHSSISYINKLLASKILIIIPSVMLLLLVMIAIISELRFFYHNVNVGKHHHKSSIIPIIAFFLSSMLLKLFPVAIIIPSIVSFIICLRKYTVTHCKIYLFIPLIVVILSILLCMTITSIIACDVYIVSPTISKYNRQ